MSDLEAGGPNSIAVSTGLIGDEWTLWIVGKAFEFGTTQYSEWLRAGTISTSVLTNRLSRLVDAGVLDRVQYQDAPARFEYRLTTRGFELWPVLISIWAWEQQWVQADASRLPDLRHADCSADLRVVLTCAACGQAAPPREVAAAFGPSGTWERSVPPATTRRRPRGGGRPAELVNETMALLGSRWSATVLGACFRGATRFSQFEENLSAPPAVIADRLRAFTALGVLEQRDTTYRLTDKGRDFFPVIVTVMNWGARWFRSPEGPAVVLTHSCGAEFVPRLCCENCGVRLRGADIDPVGTARAVG